MKPTIAEVARRAGVSIGSVSNVLNVKPHVSSRLRRKVERALKSLNYHPNGIARSLRTRRTHTIGLIVLDLSNPFYAEVIKGVENTARALGYKVVIFDVGYEPGNTRGFVDAMVEMQIDGAVFTAGYGDRAAIRRLAQTGISVVIMDRDLPEFALPSVGIDNASATYEAIKYLIAQGHRRIGYLSEPLQIRTVRRRFDGYRQALLDHGLSVDPRLVFIDTSLRISKVQHGYELMQRIIARRQRLPSAFLATSDITALGALHALKDAGYRIPRDVSLVGFDDISLAQYADPPLTTVRQEKFAMGQAAAQLLVENLNARAKARPRKITLPTTLVIRNSVAPPRR
jgi:DNA-binding LacI/PurR family transcriptional regulator